jgi:MAPEG family
MKMATDLKNEQRRVRLGALPALAITLTVFFVTAWSNESATVDPASLSTAVRAMLAPAFCLMLAIGNVANQRYFSVTDIGASTTPERTPELAIASAILANTLEQAFLAIVLYAALALLVPQPGLLLVALATMFVIGRLFFWLGYARGAGGRAFGFGLTFYPNAIGLVYVVVLAVI